MTRDELATEARHYADAESDGRWGTARVIAAMDVVLRREWRGILNANRFYRTATRLPTVDSSGDFALADLSTTAGDSSEVFYRVLGIYGGDTVYQEIQPTDVLNVGGGANAGDVWAYKTWYRNGENIRIIPAPIGTINVLVNHMPPLPSSLATGSSTVTYPTGYENLLGMEVAALMLAKGGTETEAAISLKTLAEELRRDMLSDIARISTNPTQMRYPDARGDWAG